MKQQSVLRLTHGAAVSLEAGTRWGGLSLGWHKEQWSVLRLVQGAEAGTRSSSQSKGRHMTGLSVLRLAQGAAVSLKAGTQSSHQSKITAACHRLAHEVLALEILTLLLETPTDDSVEIAIGFLKECGQKLTEVSPRGINSIFERLRNILHEGLVDLRVEYMVEAMFAIRKDGFKDHPAVLPDLDLVEEEEQFTHLLQVEDAIIGEEMLNVFKEDKSFLESEEKYKELKKEILEEGSSDEESEEGSSGSESSESDEEAEERENAEKQKILDQTETNLVALRRTIYLTIQSSLDHNECAHKMLKMELKPGQEVELCNMILDCCAQLRTYEKFFGLLAQRFCQIDKKYIEPFQQIFCEQYETIHRLETNKLRNVAKFFAHMLHTDAISWGVLSVVKLTEEDTTSASRIFLKILFQELSEYLGLLKLNQRLKDPTLAPFFEGIMPRDNPKNTRFSINFFTTIGLGGLTDDLREHLKNVTRKIVQEKQDQAEAELAQKQPSSSSSDDSDSSSSEDNSDSSDSSDSESDSHPNRKKKSTSSSAKARKVSEKSPIKSKHRKDERAEKRAKEKKQSNDMKRKFDREDRSSHDRMDRERLGGKNVSSKDKKRSRSRGKDREMNGRKKASPEKAVGIAARLLSMAQYGDIAQAAGESTSESRRNGTETKKGRDARKDRSADRGRQRRARSSEDEMARDIAGRGGSRQRNDRSESKDGKYRDDQRTKNRGRNDFDERGRDMERDFHAKDSHSWNDTRDFRNREGRDQRNSNRDNVHHEVKDGRERDSRSDRGHNFIEGRRDKDYPDWNRPRDGGRKRIREENGDRRLERPRGGEEMKKRRHDSSSGSSASSGSEASDVDKGRKRKEMQADAKGSKAAKNSVRAGADFKRQHSSPSPSKKKHARMSHPSASPSSSRSSSDKEISERKITIKKRGLSPSKDQKLKKATNSSSSSKQTKSKLLANNNSKKRPRSASSSSDSGSDSESSAASSDDSSSSGDEKISHKTEARARVEKQRRREGEDESRRRGKEMSSAARGRNEKIRGNDSRSRERKVRR
ncbi:pre-mRNA-splicing factor cwc22-like protein [Plakobranchus ocellatus]|uniref:Pre-mRNA-splicing factor cwc22-like protein n=1 Tax=Plakobranchus ocellatus TaxID=259542 RepID=A0AAV3YZQ2_9GAST|nr:pre-mRNA-splicing factor cwc22-like protein [Plakobranchus ocellatus]